MSDTYVQDAPFAMQIEAVQGCNLGCDFCGIHAIGYQQRMRGYDYMELATAEAIARQAAELGWNPRVEFAMHGEPSMHPELAELIATFRRHLPGCYLMVTSNGGGFLKDSVTSIGALFEAGLNTLALDDYESNKIVQRLLRNIGRDVFFEVHDYPAERDQSPHTRHKGQKVIIIEDISTAGAGTHSLLNNHAGSGAPLDYSLNDKRCAKPFRELSVRWDGNVAICCNDWPGTYKCGNVVTDGLEAVWQSPEMQAARAALYAGRRDLLDPCNGCNAVSYRTGLLPDKMGRVDLPFPTTRQLETAASAASGDPYTSRVRPVLLPTPTAREELL